jgi:hypothetical protein
MEPNLEDIDDYNKPLKKSKVKTLIIVFVVLLAIYSLYALANPSL